MRNKFKFVVKSFTGKIEKSIIVMNFDNITFLNKCENFIKETMRCGFIPYIYQDKGEIFKQIG